MNGNPEVCTFRSNVFFPCNAQSYTATFLYHSHERDVDYLKNTLVQDGTNSYSTMAVNVTYF
jgi:hypothetical protein